MCNGNNGNCLTLLFYFSFFWRENEVKGVLCFDGHFSFTSWFSPPKSNLIHSQSHLWSLSIQPCEKPRRLWRTLVWVWRSSRRQQGNSTLTWTWSGPVSTAPSTTQAVMTRSQTPPLPSCAATSASHYLSCRSAPTSHGYKTECTTFWYADYMIWTEI